MNAEKMIKSEAKKLLSGKWPAAVTVVMVFLLLPLIVTVVLETAYAILPQGKSVLAALKGSIVMLVVFVVFHMAAVTTAVVLSPIFTGFARFFSIMADGGKPDVNELFYFFGSRQRYRQALKLMTVILVECSAISAILLSPAIGFTVLSMRTGSEYNYMIFGTAILGIIIAFLIFHRFAFAVTLFSYNGYSFDQALSYGRKIAQKSTKKLIKLSCSFIGNMLLTFLVVPVIYVFPYMTCSYFVSVKYLIKTYKEKYGDFGDSYADQSFKIDLGVGEIPQAVNPANTVSKSPAAPLKVKMTPYKKADAETAADTNSANEKKDETAANDNINENINENTSDKDENPESKTSDEAVDKS